MLKNAELFSESDSAQNVPKNTKTSKQYNISVKKRVEIQHDYIKKAG